ncbi:MAG: adenylosuccinate synthase [Clostridia bacterium]|nr:adenylosuccinate synthase [Clostridia bacterium]
MLTSIVGINWGDEGKGRMVDLLSEEQDIVCRYQGGNNAGHTVVNERGKFILNLLPSGILRPEIVNIMGNGMVIDLEHLYNEVGRLTAAGIKITPDNLKISDRACITMPYHVRFDCLEEERLAGKKYGSTRRGIAPVYGDKYKKKAIRMGDLFYPDALREHLRDLVEYNNLIVTGVYNAEPIVYEEMEAWLEKYGGFFKEYVVDTGVYLTEELAKGKRVMFEAQLGALRDIDFGIYPYTSSSSTIAAYGPIGAGIPGVKLDRTVGIMKAYSSCVGEGPFTVEMFGKEADALRGAGGEFGAATGRPRRVGAFDVVASRYGVRVQGADELAFTKLDILSYMDKIPVCVAYDVNGTKVTEFPTGEALNIAKPVIEYHDGWKCDISGCRKVSDLPKEALDYIRYCEKAVGCKIRYVSVGAEREAYIDMDAE